MENKKERKKRVRTRAKVRPSARRGGRHVPERGEGESTSQSNVGERGRPKAWCEKEGAASYGGEGNGEARDDLDSFVADCPCVGTSPKVPRHITYS